MPGVSIRLKTMDLPFDFTSIFSFTTISLVSWGIFETFDISSPSQSLLMRFARVLLPLFGGPYKPSFMFFFFPNTLENRLLRNFVMFLIIIHHFLHVTSDKSHY